MFTPRLEILPHAQRQLWDELSQTPEEFVLYGGTALGLRLGHRRSEDFDFFSNNSFAPDVLRKRVQYLEGAEMTQFEANTLTVIVNRQGPVKVSFFGGLKLNRVQDPDVAPDNGIQVASLLDHCGQPVAWGTLAHQYSPALLDLLVASALIVPAWAATLDVSARIFRARSLEGAS